MISFSKVNLISKLLSLREVVIGRDFDGIDSSHSYMSILDPGNFLKDLVFGIIIGIELLVKGLADIFIGKAQENGEKIPGFKNGLFPNGILGSSNETRDSEETVKCLQPTTIRLILMVLCPPFAVFMKYGLLRGWFWIIIAWILTYYCYYFPGLLFSALHTMCF